MGFKLIYYNTLCPWINIRSPRSQNIFPPWYTLGTVVFNWRPVQPGPSPACLFRSVTVFPPFSQRFPIHALSVNFEYCQISLDLCLRYYMAPASCQRCNLLVLKYACLCLQHNAIHGYTLSIPWTLKSFSIAHRGKRITSLRLY